MEPRITSGVSPLITNPTPTTSFNRRSKKIAQRSKSANEIPVPQKEDIPIKTKKKVRSSNVLRGNKEFSSLAIINVETVLEKKNQIKEEDSEKSIILETNQYKRFDLNTEVEILAMDKVFGEELGDDSSLFCLVKEIIKQECKIPIYNLDLEIETAQNKIINSQNKIIKIEDGVISKLGGNKEKRNSLNTCISSNKDFILNANIKRGQLIESVDLAIENAILKYRPLTRDIEAGKIVKVGLPEDLFTLKEKEASKINPHLDRIKTHLTLGIPPIPININNAFKINAKEIKFNNYGLTLNKDDIIEINETTQRCLFIKNNQKMSGFYKDGQVFSNLETMINCDVTKINKITDGLLSMILCDGCGLGIKAFNAADTASSTGSTQFERAVQKTIPQTLQDMIAIMLDALVIVQEKMMEESLTKSMGTTTYLHAAIVDQYLTILRLGDPDAFLFSGEGDNATCIKVTQSRGNNVPSDCGGRLGNQVFFTVEGDKKLHSGPDLRNLSVYVTTVKPGDLLFICSDGIHDNFDPGAYGITPKELGLSEIEWDETIPAHAAKKEEWCVNKLLELKKGKDMDAFIKVLYDTITTVNEPSKLFMLGNPQIALPQNYKIYPGKLDHSNGFFIEIL